MKVYVIMRNDFPEAVFSEYDEAERFCVKKLSEHTGGLNVYWSVYTFTMDEMAAEAR